MCSIDPGNLNINLITKHNTNSPDKSYHITPVFDPIIARYNGRAIESKVLVTTNPKSTLET